MGKKNTVSVFNQAKNYRVNTLLSGCLDAGVLPGIEIVSMVGVEISKLVAEATKGDRPYFKFVRVDGASLDQAVTFASALLEETVALEDDPRREMLSSLFSGLVKAGAKVLETPTEAPSEPAPLSTEPEPAPALAPVTVLVEEASVANDDNEAQEEIPASGDTPEVATL